MQKLKHLFFAKHDAALIPKIRAASIGIAGAGGLGSNAAVSLARVGIGTLVIADFDTVEISNLNRQQYFLQQIGENKVEALKTNLELINPFSQYIIHNKKLDPDNIPKIFADCDIIIEAFDKADQKKMLIETCVEHFPEKPIIVGSGLAGIGDFDSLHIRKLENIYICGDEVSEIKEKESPLAPRVAIVANMQANLALELITRDNK